MEKSTSFGYWVRRRRTILDMTQADLAQKVSCSLSMLRKIERDLRRPSKQLAELLADNLAIDNVQRGQFLQMARGQLMQRIPSVTMTAAGVPRSTPIIGDQTSPTFVAREDELQQMHAHLGEAINGQGKMVFIAGEAGWGKTSLLVELAHQALAAQPDMLVAGGSSDVYTGLGDPLLPFRDIFRLLTGDIENAILSGLVNQELAIRLARALPVTVEILLDHGPHLLDTLVPSAALETRLVQNDPAYQHSATLLMRLRDQRSRRLSGATSELQQERLFEEISSTLSTLARHFPLLLILDDLHWVDASTAGLLGHLAQRLQQSPVLLVGSFRPEDLAQGLDESGEVARHALQDVLSESRRLFGENLINLNSPAAGADLGFVNALLDSEANHLDAGFRQNFARVTNGNALFAVELLRNMKERGEINQDNAGHWVQSQSLSWQYIPARVEGVIEKRITRLPAEQRKILDAASIQGENFLAEVIAHMQQRDLRQLTHVLSAELNHQQHLICEQGVQQIPVGRLSQYRFRHHLFQKYLYEQLGMAERMYLHEDVGRALEALYSECPDSDDVPALRLARHFQEAGLDAKAGHYLLLAGQNAARVLAFDEAAAHYKRGLSLMENLAKVPEIDRLKFELSFALARAYWHGGRVAKAVSAYETSITIARSLGDPDALASAVLAYEEPRWRLNLDAKSSQRYMREALIALGDKESGLHVRLLVSLARTLLASGEPEELRLTVDQALHIARRIDDPITLCDALRIFAQINRRPETTAERLAAIEEMRATAEAIGDQERLADALDLIIYDQLELGNIEQVDEIIATQMQLANDIQQPFQLHVAAVFRTMRAILQGEFAAAERLANKAADISQQIGIAALDGILGIHMFTIRAEQGRLHEIAPIVKLIVAQNPASATWRPGLAVIYAAIGEQELCREAFDFLADDGFAIVPRDSMWVTALAYLSQVCALLGDQERATTLYKLLLPYATRTVVAGGATVCYGAAGRYLGMLATVMGAWQEAEQHFTDALEMDARLGARPWLAHTQYEYAAMLVTRRRAGDQERALVLLHEASAAAREMGMAHLVQQATALQMQYENVWG